MKGLGIALALGMSLAWGAERASAVTYQVTYDGTIYAGYDTNGIFGAVNTDLAGQSVKATFVFDTTTAGAGYYSNPGVFSELYGGLYWGGTSNPLLSATVTINGNTASVANNYGYNFAYFAPPGAYNDYYAEAGNAAGTLSYARVYSYTNSFGGPELYSPFSHPVTGDSEYGHFTFNNAYDFGYYQVTRVTVGAVSEVPLPAALPLFVGGVGAMVWALRRRKHQLQTA
jgi:hypothetical protein